MNRSLAGVDTLTVVKPEQTKSEAEDYIKKKKNWKIDVFIMFG